MTLINNKRHIYRILIALTIAIIVNYFYSFTGTAWLPLATLFVMITHTGSALYQGILRYILLLLFVGFGSWIFSDMSVMHARVSDVTLGALIGVFINVVILKDRVDRDFRYAMALVLKKYAEYFQAIIELLLTKHDMDIDVKKCLVEKALQKLPFWVYERGFDLALQKGCRHFLMKISEAGEVLFSMHHLARFSYSAAIRKAVVKRLRSNTSQVGDFFVALIDMLYLKNTKLAIFDFYQNIDALEKKLKKSMPSNIDTISLSKEYVYMIEFIYNLRELQDTLVKMAAALPEG